MRVCKHAKYAWYHAVVHMPWDQIQLFLAVADATSLSGATRALGVTQPTVSRRLAELEASLGEPLFVRSVEGATLTSFGERMLEPARRMAEWAGEAERVAQRASGTPSGIVRITAPPGVAFELLAPFARVVRERLPDVRLEVSSSVQYLDLSRREADLALRLEPPKQRDLVCIASIEHQVGAFASRDYVDSLPSTYGAADVDWIGWAPPLDHLSPNPELAALIPDFRPSFASDDFLVQLRAAEAGLGAVFLARLEHRFSRWRLVELAIDLGRPIRRGLHLVCAKSALGVPRVRAIADLLAAELAAAKRSPPPPTPRASGGAKTRRIRSSARG